MFGQVVEVPELNQAANLNPKVTTRVHVKCTRCDEIFLRERRQIGRQHFCATTKTINSIPHKWCNVCKQFKPFDLFGVLKTHKSGVTPNCTECRNKYRVALNRSTFKRYMGGVVKAKKSQCVRRKLKFDLTVDFLLDVWERQNGSCYYSGVPLKWHAKHKLDSCSLERISSHGGYIKDNVVWCSKALNVMKSDATLEEFYQFLSKWNFIRGTAQIRVEHKLLHPLAKTPTKSKETDAGHDLYSIQDVSIEPGTTVNVRTGIVFTVPDGHYITIEGRSSLFKHGVIPARGIIDATYTGEMIVALTNQSHENYEIKVGDRIAQLIVHESHSIDIVTVDEFSPEYNIRGTDGFGSTGK